MKTHLVKKYEPVSITAVAGIRSVWNNGDGTYFEEPVLALVICRVREDEYSERGHLISKGRWTREVCGLHCVEYGLEMCEETTNLVGYLAEGEALTKEWLKGNGLASPEVSGQPK